MFWISQMTGMSHVMLCVTVVPFLKRECSNLLLHGDMGSGLLDINFLKEDQEIWFCSI